MDKAKKDKLLELRRKKNADSKKSESIKHTELVTAVNNLGNLFEENEKNHANTIDALLNKLEEVNSFKEEVALVKQAIESIPKTESVSVSNLSELLSLKQEVDMKPVTKALENLIKAVNKQVTDKVVIKNKKAEEFVPMRRVRSIQGRLMFDDDPMKVEVIGGGGGSIINNYSKETAKDVRFDPDESAPIYIGTHMENTDASTSSTAWFISKFTRDGNSKATRIQRRQGSWDDRAIGW